MTIDYLINYDTNKNNNSLRRKNPEGKSLSEIEELEQLYNNGIMFPKAFREYIYIGGKYNSIGLDDGLDGNFIGLMEYYGKRMQKRSIQLDRPYIIFDNFEGESFMFIYLDEGDDPQPWNVSVDEAYDTDEGEIIWKVPYPSFSDLINTLVQRALEGLQPW